MKVLRASLTLVLAVLVACGEKKKTPVALDFAAYGDCRHKTDVHRRVAKSMAAAAPKFVLVTGDLVDYPEQEAQWDEFRDIVKDLRAVAKYYCSFGDHDGTSEPGSKNLFLKEMGREKWWFDVREGDCHVFVLDSRSKFSHAEQNEWLEKTASASTAKHKFAVFHHPPFMIDDDRGKEADLVRQNIHPLLMKLKFCAAFCGHQHSFYTTLRDGVRYVITAGGGAPLWKLNPSLGQKGDLSKSFHHYVGLQFAGTKIQARVFDADGGEEESLAFTLCEHP